MNIYVWSAPGVVTEQLIKDLRGLVIDENSNVKMLDKTLVTDRILFVDSKMPPTIDVGGVKVLLYPTKEEFYKGHPRSDEYSVENVFSTNKEMCQCFLQSELILVHNNECHSRLLDLSLCKNFHAVYNYASFFKLFSTHA